MKRANIYQISYVSSIVVSISHEYTSNPHNNPIIVPTLDMRKLKHWELIYPKLYSW